jgi:3-oxoadipate enol-lactonase
MSPPTRADAIVFLHGNLSRGAHWQRQVEALAAHGFRCHAPDLRGFGNPPAAGLPTSLLDLADDVASWCEDERVDRVCVVGLSMGGAVAQAVAVRHPDLVVSLVLAGTYRLDELHPLIRELNDNATRAGIPRVANLAPMVRASFSDRFRATHAEFVEHITSEMLTTQQATLEATVQALDDFPQIRATDVVAPTVVLAGALDVLCPPAVSRHVCDAIAGAHHVELPTGHLSNLEAPDEFTACVLSLAHGRRT